MSLCNDKGGIGQVNSKILHLLFSIKQIIQWIFHYFNSWSLTCVACMKIQNSCLDNGLFPSAFVLPNMGMDHRQGTHLFFRYLAMYQQGLYGCLFVVFHL